MISFLFKPLWVMGFDYVDSQVIVKTTKEKGKFDIVIWVDIKKKGKYYRKEFIPEDITEDITEDEIECIYQQIVCEMFITKEIKD